jgi:hypothetical protein
MSEIIGVSYATKFASGSSMVMRAANQQVGAGVLAAQALLDSTRRAQSAQQHGDGTSDNIRMTPVDVPWLDP